MTLSARRRTRSVVAYGLSGYELILAEENGKRKQEIPEQHLRDAFSVQPHSINRLSIQRPSGNGATCSVMLFRRPAISVVVYAASGLSSRFKRSAISDANRGSLASPRIRKMCSSW